MGRPETDQLRQFAMNVLMHGLHAGEHHEDELSVGEARLSLMRRLGVSGRSLIIVQANLARTYQILGRHEEALKVNRVVYLEFSKEENGEGIDTLIAANKYATSLVELQHFEEARSLLKKTMPMARRVFGECHLETLRLRWNYAQSIYFNAGATLDDLRVALTTLEETAPTARRVLGVTHPLTAGIDGSLPIVRAALRARETQPGSS